MNLKTRLQASAGLGAGLVIGLTAWALAFGVPSSTHQPPQTTFEQLQGATVSPSTSPAAISPSALPTTLAPSPKAVQKQFAHVPAPANEPMVVDTPTTDTPTTTDPAPVPVTPDPIVTDDGISGPHTYAPIPDPPSPTPSSSRVPVPTLTGSLS